MSKNLKNGAFVINHDEYADVGSHWIALYISNNDVIYLGSNALDYFSKSAKKFIGNKNIQANIFRIQTKNVITVMQKNIFRIQAKNSIMCSYFCIWFIDFMLAGKTVIDYTILLSPYKFEKDDKIILIYFKNQWSVYYVFRFKKSDTI